jgi:hypothetical protein
MLAPNAGAIYANPATLVRRFVPATVNPRTFARDRPGVAPATALRANGGTGVFEITILGTVNLRMASEAKSNHQAQDRDTGLAMMDDNRAFASARSSAHPTAIAVALQHRLPQAAEIFLILALEGVARRAKTVCKNLRIPEARSRRPVHRKRVPRAPPGRELGRCSVPAPGSEDKCRQSLMAVDVVGREK